MDLLADERDWIRDHFGPSVATADEKSLLRTVNASGLPVGLFDPARRRILGASPKGRETLGFEGVDFATLDTVDAATDPDATVRLHALILGGNLAEWKYQCWLRTPGGRRVRGAVKGRAIQVGRSRRLALGLCVVPPRTLLAAYSNVLDGNGSDAVIGEPRAPMSTPMSSGAQGSAERVERLEQHLLRIALEIQAAGLHSPVLAGSSSLPALDELSPRQWEVLSRLLRGYRVAHIARELFVSASTVRNHLSVIYRKLGVTSQVELLELVRDSTRETGATRVDDR